MKNPQQQDGVPRMIRGKTQLITDFLVQRPIQKTEKTKIIHEPRDNTSIASRLSELITASEDKRKQSTDKANRINQREIEAELLRQSPVSSSAKLS